MKKKDYRPETIKEFQEKYTEICKALDAGLSVHISYGSSNKKYEIFKIKESGFLYKMAENCNTTHCSRTDILNAAIASKNFLTADMIGCRVYDEEDELIGHIAAYHVNGHRVSQPDKLQDYIMLKERLHGRILCFWLDGTAFHNQRTGHVVKVTRVTEEEIAP